MGRRPYQRYEESFRLEVVKYYYDHNEDKRATLDKYGIDHSSLRDWLRRYDNHQKVVNLLSKIEEEIAKKYKQLPEDAAVAQIEYEKLQKESENERLKDVVLTKMIELAE